MLIYLDANVVVYFIEQPPAFGPKVIGRLAALHARGDRPVVSDLTRLECRVKPLATGDSGLLMRYDSFFASLGAGIVALTAAVCDRAALIRARHRFKLAYALHLAAAAEAGCNVFLTCDAQLSRFPDLTVEVLV